MRRSKNTLAFSACISLLSLQLAGVHVHAGEGGIIGAPETPFTHSHVHHEHGDSHQGSSAPAVHGDHVDANAAQDYEGAKDVSVLDLTLSTFKMPLAVLTLFLLFAVFLRIGTLATAAFAYRVLSGRHTRWRPPLRAPPQPA